MSFLRPLLLSEFSVRELTSIAWALARSVRLHVQELASTAWAFAFVSHVWLHAQEVADTALQCLLVGELNVRSLPTQHGHLRLSALCGIICSFSMSASGRFP